MKNAAEMPTEEIRIPAIAGPATLPLSWMMPLNGVGQRRGCGDVVDDGQPGRLLHCVEEPLDQRCQQHDPDLHEVQLDEHSQGERRQRRSDGHPQQNRALVESIGERPADSREQQRRKLLHGNRDTEQHRRVRQLEHQPSLGEFLHPGAADRDRLTDREPTIVAYAEGRECRGQVALHRDPRLNDTAS
jgi:hypothetical protein